MMNILNTVVMLMTLVTLTLAEDIQGTVENNCTYTSQGGRVVSADCSRRGWTQVPKHLPATLISLDLSGNKLATLPDSPFRGCPELRTLDLSENQLSRLENSSFSGLSHLRRLSLQRNRLHMKREVFPDGVFQDLKVLQYLNLHLNQPKDSSPDLRYPDTAISALSALRTLKMDGLETNVDLGPGFAKLGLLEVLDINDVTGVCQMSALSEKFFFHINTSRPLTVNLTDCKLRSIHNETFSYLPTLHTLDLSANRHLKFPQFVQASQSFRRTQIKVLDISEIYRDSNIKIIAEDFRYLAYTWLKRLTVNKVNAYDIDLRAMFNLPTSLEYLSLYDNKLINATFMLGLYLLPHMKIVQMSRQNHFSSSEFLFDPHNHTSHSAPSDSTDTKPAAPQTWTETEKNTTTRGRNEARQNDTKLYFAPGSSSRAHRYSVHFENFPPGFGEQRDPTVHVRPGRKNSATDQMTHSSRNSILSPADQPNPKEHPDQSTFKNKAGTAPTVVEKTADEKHPAKTAMSKKSLYDPAICFDPMFIKAQESRLKAFLKRLHAFLSKHDIHFNETAGLQPLSGKSWTSGADDPNADDPNAKQDINRQTVRDGGANRNQSQTGPHFPGDFWPLPLSIRHLYGSELKLGYVLPKLHFLQNQVQSLDISRNNLPCFIGPFLGLHQLRTLDMSNNFAVYLSQNFFEDMPELTHLYLQGNFLGDSFANDSSGLIFSRLENLKVLKLNDNSIKHISSKAFLAHKNLTQLILARNAMRQFVPRLAHMAALQFLDLSDNSISFLHSQVLDDLDRISGASNLTVDLSKNPLSCGCEALPFWSWMVGNTEVRFRGREEYTCTLGNGSVIDYEAIERELDSLRLQCQGTELLAVAVGLLVSLMFVLSVLGILHYKRWQLRYFYYVGLRRLRHPYEHQHYVNQTVADDVKDVFISFDDDSGDVRVKRFVHGALKNELDRQGLTYYTSEGQFANRRIKDFIPEAILGARKTLAIFSAHFFPSYERELEFNMAVYHEEVIHRLVIVSALMGPIDWSIFPPEVLVYLEEHNCALYRPNEEDAFARTLVDRIKAEVRL